MFQHNRRNPRLAGNRVVGDGERRALARMDAERAPRKAAHARSVARGQPGTDSAAGISAGAVASQGVARGQRIHLDQHCALFACDGEALDRIGGRRLPCDIVHLLRRIAWPNVRAVDSQSERALPWDGGRRIENPVSGNGCRPIFSVSGPTFSKQKAKHTRSQQV